MSECFHAPKYMREDGSACKHCGLQLELWDWYLLELNRREKREDTIARLTKLVERTCGDGCHCMKENNEICALIELEKGDEQHQ